MNPVESNYQSECPLCRLVWDREILSAFHYEDERFMVVDCVLCHTPMLVLKVHRSDFSDAEREEARLLLRRLFGGNNARTLLSPLFRHLTTEDVRWVIDWEQRRIPDHPHCHIRPFPFPLSHHWEYLMLEE